MIDEEIDSLDLETHNKLVSYKESQLNEAIEVRNQIKTQFDALKKEKDFLSQMLIKCEELEKE